MKKFLALIVATGQERRIRQSLDDHVSVDPQNL